MIDILVSTLAEETKSQGEYMKTQETFTGFIEYIEDGLAYVSLVSEQNGDRISGQYPAREFTKLGIQERRGFKLSVFEDQSFKVEKIRERHVTEEDIKKIWDEIDEALGLKKA